MISQLASHKSQNSHVDQQVEARIAAARNKTQQQQEQRAAFAERRTAGLETRKRTKLRRRCAVCDRPLGKGRGRPCIRDCGMWLCRAPHQPPCNDVHGGQCPNRPTEETS
ncbi:hypothetical protein ACOZGD_11090 [Streptomyces murinus]